MKASSAAIALAMLLIIAGVTQTASAQTITQRGDRALDAYRFTGAQDGPLRADIPLPGAPLGSGPIYEFKSKSVARAFVMSLLLPGAGQLYTGSKLKAAMFFGVEALGWVGYIHYDGEGDDLTAQYEDFADAHWYDGPYWDSLNVYHGVDKWRDDDVFAHHLPYRVDGNGDTVVNKNHEYYENVGKYEQFVWGWDDLQQIESPVNSSFPELSFTSRRRFEYVAMREDANQSYDRARASLIVLVVNHVASALEAAFAAKRYNSQAQHARRLEVDFKLVNQEATPSPWVRVAYSF